MLKFNGERIIPQTPECEPTFNRKMYQEHIARYVFALQICKDRTVLDVGCGVGYGSHFLATNGAKNVVALDIAEDALDHARQYYSAPNLDFRCLSATDLAESAIADVVTCFEVIEHVEDQQSVLAAIKKALKPNGVAIISTPRPLEKIRSEFHVKELPLDEFRHVLGHHFSHIEMFQENNHFASLVGGDFTPSLDNIYPTIPPPLLDGADYFIAVVSNAAIDRKIFQDRLVLNDDSYVLRLEHDVGVLRKAESDWRDQIDRFDARLRDLAGADVAQRLEDNDAELVAVKAAYELTSFRLAAIMNATFWRATGPLRVVAGRLPAGVRVAIRNAIKTAYRVLKPGWHGFLHWRAKSRQNSGVNVVLSSPHKIPLAAHYRVPLKECRVLFISGDNKSPSHIYRVDNMLRGLRGTVAATEVVPLYELWRVIDRIADFHIVVFWRVSLGPEPGSRADIRCILSNCESHGIATFFDIDDLVFDPEICTPRYIDGLRYIPKNEMSTHRAGVRGYRDMMLACKNVLVPTAELKSRTDVPGLRGFVVPNGLDAVYEQALHRSEAAKTHDDVVIGYSPGTRTHQKNFAVAAGALGRLLASHPKARLHILGPLDLKEFPALLALVGKQVFVDASVGRTHVFRFNQEIDINIVPLEADNPYVAAKSELKYFEAAVFGVPTVSSDIGPYRDCIVNGDNGFRAATEEEWFAALTLLVDEPERRQQIGQAARSQVAGRYTANVIAQSMLEAFDAVRCDMARESNLEAPVTPTRNTDASAVSVAESQEDNQNYQGDRPLTINWMVPGLIIGGGGHRSILRAAHHLSRFGHRIRLYFTDTNLSASKLAEMVREHFYPLHCPMYVYDGTMEPADVVFGTYWSTVYKALRHRHVCPNVFYFVQDFEPMFFPMGSDYIMAENTYRLGLYHITAGPWCADFLHRQYDAEADSFVFPIQDVYRPQPRTKKNLNVLFFAKPDMPRRCFELGIEMLKRLKEGRPDVEIITFGSPAVSRSNLPFPVTCKGLLPTIDDLVGMYSNADLGVVFSPTNPSLVPYEMLSCGLPVVDMDRIGAQVNYGNRRDIVLLADPVPEVMAKQIADLLDDPEERARRSAAGRAFAATFPDEEEMGRRVESLIIERLRSCQSANIPDSGQSSYRQKGTGT